MKKYISIDLLKLVIEAEPYFTDSTKVAFRNIVNKVPAADVVEVVRCKDCKHQIKAWNKDKRFKNGGYWFCSCEINENLGCDNEFCSQYESRAHS